MQIKHIGKTEYHRITRYRDSALKLDWWTLSMKNMASVLSLIPRCDKSPGTPIDFMFCLPALLPFIRVGMLSINDGGSSDHRAFGIDKDTSTIWGRVSSIVAQRGKVSERRIKRKHRSMWRRYIEEQRSMERLKKRKQHPWWREMTKP